MALTQQTFDVPDREPWKDETTLDGLYHDDGLNQTEIAEHFTEQGHEVTASTISYWMGKFEIETRQTSYDEDDDEVDPKCEYHEVCGNDAPGPRNGLCDSCMEVVRQRSRDGYDCPLDLDGDDFTSMTEHIERLYELYQ